MILKPETGREKCARKWSRGNRSGARASYGRGLGSRIPTLYKQERACCPPHAASDETQEFTVQPMLLEHTSKCPILVVIEPQPNPTSADFHAEFKSIAVPLVDQAIAASGDFSDTSRILKGEFPGKLLP